MTTGDIGFLLWLTASIRVMWLLLKLWAANVNGDDDEWWDACLLC